MSQREILKFSTKLHRSVFGCAFPSILLLASLLEGPGFSQGVNDGFDPNANGPVCAIAVQADGRIVIGGAFTTVAGLSRTNLARLNADGSVDASFTPSVLFTRCGVCQPVASIALQADGKILVAGEFDQVNGQPRNGVARLCADGSLDTNFNVALSGEVNALLVLRDGRILVGGKFGTPAPFRQGLIRLASDGSVDDFSVFGNNSLVASLALEPDGRILVGGSFSAMNGLPRANLGRLNSDGTVDTAFNPSASGQVSALAVEVDGQILVGGCFNALGGQPRGNIGRLNSDGTLDTTFNPGASNEVRVLVVQPDGKVLVGGYLTNLAGAARSHLGRLLPDGAADVSFNPGANSNVWAMAVQSDGSILVGGAFTALGGTNRNYIGRLYPGGTVDATLNPGVKYDPVALNTAVNSLAVQLDGKILVGGLFTTLGGQARTNLGRLNADGNLDSSFNPGTDAAVRTLCVQSDGKILVGGDFMTLGGHARTAIGRLGNDGNVDSSFTPSVAFNSAFVHPFPAVYALAFQADDKIILGGIFTAINDQPRRNLGRLNGDGAVDPVFHAAADGSLLDASVRTVAVQADGKILVSGAFDHLGGQARTNLGRLNADGTLDTNFNPGANSPVFCLWVQADARILVAGGFTMLGGEPRSYIGRLNPDGAVDSSFNPGTGTTDGIGPPDVYALAVQADGKILVGGRFTTLAGQPRNHLGRLNNDGSLDTLFNPGADSHVDSLAVQADGNILAGGAFNKLGGQVRNYLGRLSSGEAAMQSLSLSLDGSLGTWTRSGSGPELEEVTFETSTDGLTYNSPVAAMRGAGNWFQRLARASITGEVYVRARGRARSGRGSGSSGLVESVARFYRMAPPRISASSALGVSGFRFTFSNPTGTAFTVLTSTNVETVVGNWGVLGSPVSVGGGIYEFTDPAATNFARRFYQLRSP